MIQEMITYVCRACGSANIIRNGTNRCGNAQYHCKDCGIYRVLSPKSAYSEIDKRTVLRAGLERCSLHGVERIFDITRQTVVRWISTHIQKLLDGAETLLPASPNDIIELDEVWIFVLKKRAHGGCGLQCADGHAKSWRLLVATAAKQLAFVFGKPSQTNTNTAIRSVIMGQPINTSFQQKPISVLEKKLERQPIENGGTIPCVSG